jgi:glycerophosphoryl diester phosphodiesterase
VNLPLISAHRCGAGDRPEFDNTLAGIQRAAAGPAEFVEFDVHRCADGTLVLSHEPVSVSDGLCSYADALTALRGHKQAHIDLKFTSPEALYATPERTDEARAARMATEILGDAFIITSLEDRSIRAVRDWADAEGRAVRAGLSLGRGLREIPWRQRPGLRLSELAPRRRMQTSGANLVAANHRLARVTLARYAARDALPLLVWTVDDPRGLRAWLSDPRVWLLTTNQPDLAVQIRDQMGP